MNNMRLMQGIYSKPIKSIREGVNNQVPFEKEQADPKASPKIYAQVALCCLSDTNPFRNAVI